MLEFFVIFSKSGIVLFATVNQSLDAVINGLVKHVFLEERTGQYQVDQLQIKYLLDNEFELLFVVGYQKFLQLCYVDKFLDKIKLAFRDKFSDFDLKRILNNSFEQQTRNILAVKQMIHPNKPISFGPSPGDELNATKHARLDFGDLIIDEGSKIFDMSHEFAIIYAECVRSSDITKKQETSMRTFQDSAKSKKTIASMIVQKDDPSKNTKSQSNNTNNISSKTKAKPAEVKPEIKPEIRAEIKTELKPEVKANVVAIEKTKQQAKPVPEPVQQNDENNIPPLLLQMRAQAPRQMLMRPGKPKKTKKDSAKNTEPSKKGKAARQWDLCGSNPDEFDFSKKPTSQNVTNEKENTEDAQMEVDYNSSSMNKNIEMALSTEDVETNLVMTDNEVSEDEDLDEEMMHDGETLDHLTNGQEKPASKSSYFGSIWKTISYNKILSDADLAPVLDQLREHLTAKNVASQIAEEICDNIGEKLKGLQVNTWINLKKFAKDALEEAILRILNPSKNINILREVQAKENKPYVIVLCGVNGVGKSTNLAKIVNWLILNQHKVLVVAGDTFRAGAIEQLRTHVRALKSIHERPKGSCIKVELFEKGYRKDADNIAREAIIHARANQFDVVIVDTAGRMQDNEPLMRQLAKLIKNNSPDLTLFVGEALVGNEAVDQLTKFNSALISNGCQLSDSNRSAIDGIILTKFDTIDDQVGAAISMTYVTGKPIVFVGVGQTYRDLKQLDAKAVTKALMR